MDYYRITAYHPDEDISVILDSNGKFDTLWEYSSHLVSQGFKILALCRENAFAECTFPLIENSKKLAVRAIAKGIADINDFECNNRKCRSISVGDKIYVQYMN